MFNSDRYDPAWFLAVDGGDALTGKCFASPLLQGNVTSDLFASATSTTKVGLISWTQDFKGSNDVCGDIITTSGGGAVLKSVDIAKNVAVICDDKNGDGVLDFGICFSWRERGADDTCVPDFIYPGSPSKCFCARYDVPQITIKIPDNPVGECL